MSNRFITDKVNSPIKNTIISVLIFVVVIGGFWFVIDSLSAKTNEQEIETLETAINHSITQCYAIEGSYPQDMQYLRDNYGITYNEERYIVHYEVLGSNLMPSVTIIAKEDE
ncbi:MAG: hypothetical protein ACK5LL_03175 [Suipraeoptans sp.]